ncbi:MAG: 50S ribosomal protein L1 [Aigarchaeota archaeon]|nr:50S ribosomal protein L1 [Aigarchaeota archaeon]MDW8093003.1 50S ribosomal protein L1 [Nitrososphaerota archaeon]
METVGNLGEAVTKVLTKKGGAKFNQSVELIINVRDVDLSKPENRFTEVVELPHGLGSKPRRVAVIASGNLAYESSRSPYVDKVFERNEVEALIGNKKAAKKVAREYDYFLVEPSLVPVVARALGASLGPLGKAPIPIPPNQDINSLSSKYKKSVTVKMRKVPQVSCVIGEEGMKTSELLENAQTVLNRVVEKLDRKWQNVKSVYIKKTMGEPIKVMTR